MTVEKVKQAIDKLFSDTACTQDETRDKLKEIIEHAKSCIEALGDI